MVFLSDGFALAKVTISSCSNVGAKHEVLAAVQPMLETLAARVHVSLAPEIRPLEKITKAVRVEPESQVKLFDDRHFRRRSVPAKASLLFDLFLHVQAARARNPH